MLSYKPFGKLGLICDSGRPRKGNTFKEHDLHSFLATFMGCFHMSSINGSIERIIASIDMGFIWIHGI